MLQEHSILRVVPTKNYRLAAFAAAIVPALLLAGASWAQDGSADAANAKKKSPAEPAVHLLKSVAIPKNSANTTPPGMFSFDISFVDQATGNYYLADRSNKAVDAIAAETFVTQIQPSAGHA